MFLFYSPFLDLRYLFFRPFLYSLEYRRFLLKTIHTGTYVRTIYKRGLILLLIPAKVWPDRTTKRGYGIFLVMEWYGTDTRA